MIINALTEFGKDLHYEEMTRVFAAKIPECPDGRIEINLSGCILDYDATSVIMDTALERLERAQPPRELAIVFNIKFQERLFLKWLFFGSKRLGLDQGIMSDDEIRAKLVEGLRKMGIVLNIRVVDPRSGTEMLSLSYGQ